MRIHCVRKPDGPPVIPTATPGRPVRSAMAPSDSTPSIVAATWNSADARAGEGTLSRSASPTSTNISTFVPFFDSSAWARRTARRAIGSVGSVLFA